MTSSIGSISINGLLGGMAGKIDTDALVKALMAAKSMPKQQLQLQMAQQGKVTQSYQTINSTMTSITSLATTVADSASWSATKAASSSTSVVASSAATAAAGSTVFNVTALATTQVSTVKADGSGDWVANFSAGLDITVGVGGAATSHHIDLESASIADIATAVNAAGIGVRAAVVNTDQGQVLQLSSAKTGAENAFTVSGMTQSAQELTAAQDAKVTVGTLGGGGYTISSATNTFTDAMPGVTFTVSKLESDVTISVGSDTSKVSGMVQSLVNSVNSAKLAIANYTDKGGVLQGDSNAISLNQDMSSVFSSATATGKSLTEYGIDMSKDGLVSFDADAFAAAYATDPAGTMQAISDAVATPLKSISEASSAPITGSISQMITSGNDRVADMNKQVDNWTERLGTVEVQLRTKYVAMQVSLASLQSQGDWLTSMFKSMDGSNKDS